MACGSVNLISKNDKNILFAFIHTKKIWIVKNILVYHHYTGRQKLLDQFGVIIVPQSVPGPLLRSEFHVPKRGGGGYPMLTFQREKAKVQLRFVLKKCLELLNDALYNRQSRNTWSPQKVDQLNNNICQILEVILYKYIDREMPINVYSDLHSLYCIILPPESTNDTFRPPCYVSIELLKLFNEVLEKSTGNVHRITNASYVNYCVLYATTLEDFNRIITYMKELNLNTECLAYDSFDKLVELSSDVPEETFEKYYANGVWTAHP